MNAYGSPPPKGVLLQSSTPTVSRFKHFVSPQQDYNNNENRDRDTYATHLREFSPIIGTFFQQPSASHQSKGTDSSLLSLTNSLDRSDVSATELQDKLPNDSSVFSTHLRDTLAYSEQLRTSTFQTFGPSLRLSKNLPMLLEKVCKSLAQGIRFDVGMILEYKDVYPEVLNVQVNNIFSEEVDDEYGFDVRTLIHPLLDSDRITSSFDSISEILRTKFACLYKASHRFTGMLCCLKRSLSESTDHHSFVEELVNEINALSLLEHKNVVRYFDSWLESETAILATEFCLGGSLFNYLHPIRPHASVLSNHDSFFNGSTNDVNVCKRKLTESALVHLLQQMSCALDYLHTKFHLVHGDIKPSNILIQLPDDEAQKAYSSGEPVTVTMAQCIDILQSGIPNRIVFKLSDFGRSSLANSTRERESLGDGRYLPSLDDPSERACAAFGRDIYALGVTLYHAAGGDMNFAFLERFRYGDFASDDAMVLPVALRPIVASMLKRYAADRPTASDLLASLPFSGSN